MLFVSYEFLLTTKLTALKTFPSELFLELIRVQSVSVDTSYFCNNLIPHEDLCMSRREILTLILNTLARNSWNAEIWVSKEKLQTLVNAVMKLWVR
jgi:hypothetical protein